jgi:hypothetical protein
MPTRESKSQLAAAINIATVAEHTIVAAVSGQRIRVYAMWWWSGGTVQATPKSDSTILSGTLNLIAQSNPKWDPRLDDEPWFTTAVGEAFVISLAQATQVSGVAHYVQSAN